MQLHRVLDSHLREHKWNHRGIMEELVPTIDDDSNDSPFTNHDESDDETLYKTNYLCEQTDKDSYQQRKWKTIKEPAPQNWIYTFIDPSV